MHIISNIDIIALIGGLVSFFGAIGVFIKSKSDAHKNNTEAVNNQIKSVQEVYSHMLKDQVSALVEPMQQRIERLETRVGALKEEVLALQQFQSLFKISVVYIRNLCHWIDTLGVDKNKKPRLPKELKKYLEEEELL